MLPHRHGHAYTPNFRIFLAAGWSDPTSQKGPDHHASFFLGPDSILETDYPRGFNVASEVMFVDAFLRATVLILVSADVRVVLNSCLMACSVVAEIELIIECDRKMIHSYFASYVIIGIVATAILLGFHQASESSIPKVAEAAVTSIAIPIFVLHLKRKNALTPLLVLRMRGQQCGPDDPACHELRLTVDELLKKRLEAGASE